MLTNTKDPYECIHKVRTLGGRGPYQKRTPYIKITRGQEVPILGLRTLWIYDDENSNQNRKTLELRFGEARHVINPVFIYLLLFCAKLH